MFYKHNGKCPNCGEDLIETESGIILCLDCGYHHDPNPKEILQDISDQITEDLLFDIDIENIFKCGFERVNQLNRDLIQIHCNKLLGIGFYSPYLSLDRSSK